MKTNLFPFFYYFILGISLLFFVGCASTRPPKQLKYTANLLKTSPDLKQSFTGFVLYDPAKKEFLYEQYADKYMTPASNTKLYTFFAGLNLLGDSIPAIQYSIKSDSLFFWGMGDPSFLNADFGEVDSLYNFLKSRKETLVYLPRPTKDAGLGPGWSWDDYTSYYSSERSKFPIYANNLFVEYTLEDNAITVKPPYFKDYVTLVDTLERNKFLQRDFDGNTYKVNPNRMKRNFTRAAPFHYSDTLFVNLLADTLKRAIVFIEGQLLPKERTTFYSHPIDTLYRKMLQPSDNLYAEQILLMCSAMLSDTLSSRATINCMKDSVFADAPAELAWVDGSGLSRYNMFTPRTTIRLLEKIYNKVGEEERLFGMLAAGGVSGTIRNWYAGKNGNPYVFAKTGTLSNNHCLSGYLKAKSGKLLMFSFMHNHYTSSSNNMKMIMQTILEDIYTRY